MSAAARGRFIAILDDLGWRRGDRLFVPTSGTTAAPRVVERSLASWVDAAEAFTEATGIGSRDRVYLPPGAASSLYVWGRCHAAYVGATVVNELGGATAAHLTPGQLARALAEPAAGLERVVCAGAALPGGLRSRAEERGLEVVSYYGAAELSFVAIGRGELRAFARVEAVERAGVLWVRSPWVATGYAVGSPSGPLTVDGAGWASVGDRGEIVDGVVRVFGRGSDQVLTGGVSVLVADVESVLRSAPGVLDVCVVGLPSEDLGQLVGAAVVLGSSGKVASVRAAAREGLDRGHRPVRYLAVDALPLTAGGKVDRAAVAAMMSA